MPPADQPPDFVDLLHSWVFEHFGIVGLVLLALGGIVFYLWSHWGKVRTWPGVSSVVEYIGREALPKADPHRFSVAVAHLEDDENGALEQLVFRLLRDLEGIQILSFDRAISTKGTVPEEREREAHRKARGYLEESGASVLIWGGVLRHEGQAIPDLYLTAAPGEPGKPTQYRLDTETEFRLPKVFWDDLSEVLQLVIATRNAEFRAEEGRYVADRLRPFIARVRSLLEGSADRPGWDQDSLSSTRLILAEALSTYGEQAGKSEPLEEAVAAYRAALAEYTRERVPLDWAMTQNNLGNALSTLGERESGTARLEEAVAAYRAALEEYTRERVPLQWAATQNNLGATLRALGERESGTARLEEAVAAFRAALEILEAAQASHYASLARDNLLRVQALLTQRRGTPE